MSTPTLSPTAPLDPVPAGQRRRGRPILRILLLVVCLAIAAMWIYALFFASKKAAYKVDDPAWRANAEQVCARYEAQRLALTDTASGYIAEPTPAQMRERADVVDQATDLLEAMVDEMTAFPTATERDQQLVATYRGFYETMIADRRAYTARLRALELAPYRETEVGGGPVTNLLVDFSTVNELEHCRPPQELGGDS